MAKQLRACDVGAHLDGGGGDTTVGFAGVAYVLRALTE